MLALITSMSTCKKGQRANNQGVCLKPNVIDHIHVYDVLYTIYQTDGKHK